MPIADAKDFLQKYASAIESRAVAGWQWDADDDVFGKTVSWECGTPDLISATATVDLSATQLQLTITERDISGEGDPRDVDSEVVFNGLVAFEDRMVTLGGVTLPYSDASIRQVITEFNERV